MYFVRMAVTKIYNLRDFKFVTEVFRNREKKINLSLVLIPDIILFFWSSEKSWGLELVLDLIPEITSTSCDLWPIFKCHPLPTRLLLLFFFNLTSFRVILR